MTDRHKYEEIEKFKQWLYRTFEISETTRVLYHSKIMSFYRFSDISDFYAIKDKMLKDYIQKDLDKGIEKRVIQSQMRAFKLFKQFLLEEYGFVLEVVLVIENEWIPEKEDVEGLISVIREAGDKNAEFIVRAMSYSGLGSRELCELSNRIDIREKCGDEAFCLFQEISKEREDTLDEVLVHYWDGEWRKVNETYIYRTVTRYGGIWNREKRITPRVLQMFYKKSGRRYRHPTQK